MFLFLYFVLLPIHFQAWFLFNLFTSGHLHVWFVFDFILVLCLLLEVAPKVQPNSVAAALYDAMLIGDCKPWG